MSEAATDDDVANTEAWAEIIEDMLYLVPDEHRAEVLALATAKEQAAQADRDKHGRFRIYSLEEFCDGWKNSPSARNWNAIMRLKSLVIQVFARNITNEHSPQEAAAILFADQRHGSGSGCLTDYIDDLPRTTEPSRQAG